MYKTEIISNDKIGTSIRRRRNELSLSQEELASKLGVSRQQVQRYENGKDMLSVEKLQAICHYLSVPVTYLLCHSSDDAMQETEFERELLSLYPFLSSTDSRVPTRYGVPKPRRSNVKPSCRTPHTTP
jgi:transcriptional regulator with XRE-family HTH domain